MQNTSHDTSLPAENRVPKFNGMVFLAEVHFLLYFKFSGHSEKHQLKRALIKYASSVLFLLL